MKEIDLLKERNDKIDWFSLRNQAAIVNAAAILGNNELITRIGIRSENDREDIHTTVAKCAIEHADSLINELQKPQFLKQGEQKPNYCHHEVDLSDCSEEYRKAYYDGWNNCNQQHSQLKAEQNPAWSEEDEVAVKDICDRLNRLSMTFVGNESIVCQEEVKWLKSLKDRVQPKQEWSEEDERIYQSIMDDTVQENQLGGKQINWLRTLKHRLQWKPSKEQMEAIKDAIEFLGCTKKVREDLKSLYEQMKKLTE